MFRRAVVRWGMFRNDVKHDAKNDANTERTSFELGNGEGLSLWFAYPGDLLIAGSVDEWAGVLTDEERARMQAFRFDEHRREYLATRVLVHRVLSHLWPSKESTWQFARNEYGKPRVEPECGLRFNLANSVGLVVCLAGYCGEIGVDVEPYARAEAILELAGEVFSPLELVQLEPLPQALKLERALSLWTLKEAYIKARGMGLSLPLEEISFLFEDEVGIRLELGPGIEDDAAGWRFCLIDRAEHRVAVMREAKTAAHLELFELRPLNSAPQPLSGIVMEWFPRL